MVKLKKINMYKWFSKTWWKYLLEKPKHPEYCNWWYRILCRLKGHPNGVIFYNISGNEPDMRCKNCYDDLG